jgi:23S rRNA (cytidine1920-2'-O)/16S rRNA (cytidine1409-2'-O)-methyltransferase
VKPQFEAGRDKVGKKGVVRDKKVHLEVVCQIMTYAIQIGFEILELSFSPIKGPEGNIEYLLYLEKKAVEEESTAAEEIFQEKYLELAKKVVEEAHGELDK